MSDVERIKTSFERNAEAVSLRPSFGQGTHVMKVRVRDGLTCDIEEDSWKMTADMDPKAGGNGVGPAPGVFGRAALGGCLAIGYAWWAAKLDVPISNIEIEVQADYDARGMYAVADVPAGWTAVRYTVMIESTASEVDIQRVLDTADAHSPLLDNFSRALSIEREVRIAAPTE